MGAQTGNHETAGVWASLKRRPLSTGSSSHPLGLLNASSFTTAFSQPVPGISLLPPLGLHVTLMGKGDQVLHIPPEVKNGIFARDSLRGSLRLQGKGWGEPLANAPKQGQVSVSINPPIQHVKLWQDLLNGRDPGQWLPLPSSPAARSHGGLQQSLRHGGKGQLPGVPGCTPPWSPQTRLSHILPGLLILCGILRSPCYSN